MGDFINPNHTPAITGGELAADDLVLVVDKSARDADGSRDTGLREVPVSQLVQGANKTTIYAADGAIAVQNGTAKLTKGSAGAYTLAAPSAEQEGMRVLITSGSAYAHVVTSTGNIHDGVTGGAKNAATFAAFLGATIELIAINQKWHTVALKAVTVA